MHNQSAVTPIRTISRTEPAKQPLPGGGERQIGVNDLEGGAYVKIVASNSIDTAEALEWAEDIIARKRKELERLKKRVEDRVDTSLRECLP